MSMKKDAKNKNQKQNLSFITCLYKFVSNCIVLFTSIQFCVILKDLSCLQTPLKTAFSFSATLCNYLRMKNKKWMFVTAMAMLMVCNCSL
jgi:hypothetical protein